MKWLLPALAVLVAGCSPTQEGLATGGDRLLITAKRIYVAPDAPPIDDGWVLVRGESIEAVGDSASPPAGGAVSTTACSGRRHRRRVPE